MTKIIVIVFNILLLVGISNCLAQKRNINSGDEAFVNHNYFRALKYYLKAKEKTHNYNYYVISQIANCYHYLNNYKQAKAYYNLVSQDLLSHEDLCNFAQNLQNLQNYKKAIIICDKAIQKGANNPLIATYKQSCKWAMNNAKKSSSWKASHYKELSTSGLSFGVQFYKDGVVYSTQTLSDMGDMDIRGYDFLDLYYAIYINNKIGKPELFSKELVFPFHVGAVSFSDNYSMIYFTLVERVKLNQRTNKRLTNLKIYSAKFENKKWGQIKELFFNSEKYSCAHPAISKDGKTMVFTSDMPEGYGGKDLYVVKKNNGIWSNPENLGKEINTSGNEIFPFIDLSNNLYFASDGHIGYGGLDIYSATKIGNEWSNVQNLMKPLNSSKDDFAFVLNPKNDSTGFISSNRIGSGFVDYVFKINKINTVIDTTLVAEKSSKKIELNIDVISDTSNIVYKIQYASSRRLLNSNKKLAGYETSTYQYKGLYRYTIGEFHDRKEAEKLRNKILKMGYKSAFIAIFQNNKRTEKK